MSLYAGKLFVFEGIYQIETGGREFWPDLSWQETSTVPCLL